MRSLSRDILTSLALMAVGWGSAKLWAEDATELPSTRPAAAVPATQDAKDARPQYWFGVAVEGIPPVLAKHLKLQVDQGLLVMAVLPNSPAERAGLKPDDLLIEIDGSPLTSQEDLARAANANRMWKSSAESRLVTPPHPSKMTFLRDGDKRTVSLMPGQRPESMVVYGNNLGNFTVQRAQLAGQLQAANGAGNAGNSVQSLQGVMPARNVVLPNGVAAQIGPGYTMDLTATVGTGSDSTVVAKSIRQIVNKGQPVVFTQELAPTGVVSNQIAVDGKTYVVEKGTMETLPADLRPLAEQLISNVTSVADGAAMNTATDVRQVISDNSVPDTALLERRVSELEKQNASLQSRLQELIDLLKKQNEKSEK
jgi:hypothetical protein